MQILWDKNSRNAIYTIAIYHFFLQPNNVQSVSHSVGKKKLCALHGIALEFYQVIDLNIEIFFFFKQKQILPNRWKFIAPKETKMTSVITARWRLTMFKRFCYRKWIPNGIQIMCAMNKFVFFFILFSKTTNTIAETFEQITVILIFFISNAYDRMGNAVFLLSVDRCFFFHLNRFLFEIGMIKIICVLSVCVFVFNITFYMGAQVYCMHSSIRSKTKL